MKDEIKKKIEEEALRRFPLASGKNGKYFPIKRELFAKAATYGYSLAQQSVNSELYSEIERLIISWNIDAHSTAGTLTRQIISVISASKNKQ